MADDCSVLEGRYGFPSRCRHNEAPADEEPRPAWPASPDALDGEMIAHLVGAWYDWPEDMLAEAALALNRLKAREFEDHDIWAEELASDLARFTD